MGDSLSAEYGLERGSGWVARIAEKLKATKYTNAAGNASDRSPLRIENTSISGDTTSGGLSRLPAALARFKPRIVIIELGSNDALRGLSLKMVEQNLARMIELCREADAQVLLVGMQLPPNYGRAYTEQFRSLYGRLASHYRTALVPFLLEGMASDRRLFQEDGIHPNEKAQDILADNVWKALEPMLKVRG